MTALERSKSGVWKIINAGVDIYNPSQPHARCLGAGTVTNRSELTLFGGCLTGGGQGGPCPSKDAWTFDISNRFVNIYIYIST